MARESQMLGALGNFSVMFLTMAFVYFGSFICMSKFAATTMPRIYVPMRYVLESRISPPLRSSLEQLGIDVDLVHCMLY
jgi:hypothetical protein